MATARVKNYVKKNPEKIEEWRKKVLYHELLVRLNSKHVDPDKHEEYFGPQDITGHGGQNKIFEDVMDEHFLLGYSVSRKSAAGYTREMFIVHPGTFLEMIKGLDEKPVFDIQNQEKRFKEDIYTALTMLSLGNLVYIFNHQDEFTFIYKEGTTYRRESGAAVIYKDIEEEADRLAFRNAIAAYYEKKMPLLGTVVCDKDFSHINKPEWDHKEGSHNTYEFGNYITGLIPHRLGEVNTKNVKFSIEGAEHGIEYLQNLVKELKEMEASIQEAGGDEEFHELFYKKAIGNFYRNIPLYINVEDRELQRLARRAAKKTYT